MESKKKIPYVAALLALNKTDVLREDIEQTAEGVMESEKKLPYAAAMLALNRSAAFCINAKGKNKIGNVEYNVSSIQTL